MYPTPIKSLLDYIHERSKFTVHGDEDNAYYKLKNAKQCIESATSEEAEEWLEIIAAAIHKTKLVGEFNYSKYFIPHIVADDGPIQIYLADEPEDCFRIDNESGDLMHSFLNLKKFNLGKLSNIEIGEYIGKRFWNKTTTTLDQILMKLQQSLNSKQNSSDYFINPEFILTTKMIDELLKLELPFKSKKIENSQLFYESDYDAKAIYNIITLPIKKLKQSPLKINYECENPILGYILKWLETHKVLSEASFTKAEEAGIFYSKTKKQLDQNSLSAGISKCFKGKEKIKLLIDKRVYIYDKDCEPLDKNDIEEISRYLNYQLARIFKPDLIQDK